MRRKIAVADCETDPFRAHRIPQPFIWGFYDGDVYRQFPEKPSFGTDATEAFIKFVSRQPVILYAHNGGKFDWHFVLPYATAYDDLMIINGRIARMNIGMAECRDSFNILPVPLSAYKKDTIDYDIMEKEQRYKSKNWRKISDYLQSDCVYLYELVAQFVERYGVQLTQASAAMSQWKKISNEPLPRSQREFYDLLAPYYYGGRVECFESGIIDCDFGVYDINSAYPYAMLQEHPYSTDFIHVDGYVKDADFYKVSCISRGAFPFRGMGEESQGGFGLRFPNDGERRIYTVTRWEYNAAIDTGTIERQRVLESISFGARVNFRKYIEHFYSMRLRAIENGNDAESLFAKLLMNSLYGKFASNPENYRNYMIVPMDTIAGLELNGWQFAGELGPWALAEAPLTEAQQHYYNVATSASITGFVRAYLWRAICSSSGIMYCDTDSIAARQPGMRVEMEMGDALGQWKCEGRFDRAGIAGKKLYIFRGVKRNGERKFKTASKGARLTHRQLWDCARGIDVNYIPEVPTFSPVKAPRFVSRRIKFTA